MQAPTVVEGLDELRSTIQAASIQNSERKILNFRRDVDTNTWARCGLCQQTAVHLRNHKLGPNRQDVHAARVRRARIKTKKQAAESTICRQHAAVACRNAWMIYSCAELGAGSATKFDMPCIGNKRSTFDSKYLRLNSVPNHNWARAMIYVVLSNINRSELEKFIATAQQQKDASEQPEKSSKNK
jgi:hypothetical protein